MNTKRNFGKLIDSDRTMLEDIRDNLFLFENEWEKFSFFYPEDAKRINKDNFINMCIIKYYLNNDFND